jgi:MFS superfamily sulfate permease-like transporter
MSQKLKNKFSISELSGGLGDLGTLIPLAFALVVYNNYKPGIIFLLWGIVYMATGWFYRVPVSVQPLKAMAVIAIAKGFTPLQLSSTAFFYGILMILLASTGIISWLQRWFSPALVKGIQLGIGLILAQKAIQLVLDKGLLLEHSSTSPMFNYGLLLLVVVLIWVFQFKRNFPMGEMPKNESFLNNTPWFIKPNFSFFIDALIFLIIPQLPLTLGNSIFAANDACHTLWGQRSERVNPTRLSFSIGISDTIIGLLGGFPICHGAGGIGAHAQFGAKTGGATIIMGTILIICAIIPQVSNVLFLIPVPILAAMLLFDSWRMIILIRKLNFSKEFLIAITVGLLSFATHNLSIALATGFILELLYSVYQKQGS